MPKIEMDRDELVSMYAHIKEVHDKLSNGANASEYTTALQLLANRIRAVAQNNYSTRGRFALLSFRDYGSPGIEKAALTSQEIRVLESLMDAWNGFVRLEEEHPDDTNEFRLHLHVLQQLIALRVARRVDPDRWVNTSSEA